MKHTVILHQETELNLMITESMNLKDDEEQNIVKQMYKDPI